MNQIPVLNFQEYISADGDSLLTDSKKVAFVFGKRHDHVIRAIRTLMSKLPIEFSSVNFGECFIVNELANGKQEPMFRMTKDGFSLLVMGFTGEKALMFKLSYIAAFNEMAKLQHNIRYGLMFECNKKHLEYKGKKRVASECGRGLNEWKQEKPALLGELETLEQKLQPQLPFTLQ